MNNSEKNVKIAIEEGVKTVVIREGEAPKISQLENVIIAGCIDSASRFFESRNADFQKNKSFTIVNRYNKTINSVLNEDLEFGQYQIKGKIEISKDYNDLGINLECVHYTPVKLSQKLKMMRSFFPNASEYNTVVSTLRNLKASINKKVEDLNDQRGNTSRLFEQTVESNMPEQFELNLCLIKGQPNKRFFVSINLEAEGTEIKCFLESIDAKEIIDNLSNELIDIEVEKIKEFTTIIEQ